AMGSETPAGMAHTALQQYLKDLSGAGVLLNVCSKNEDDAARAGLRQPAATLREEDFVCFCANWQPKDANLAAMAKQLNLLPESFVFLDDNPAERALVRQSLPGVAVPELAGPELCAHAAGYFYLQPGRRQSADVPG
ncbi:MAG: HAD-IIIC family phosphatase, partial [Ruthenibacterium sp.]